MALVESIVSFACDKIREQLVQEVAFLSQVSGQVEFIQRELVRMQAFLRVAEQKQKEGDERVKIWVAEVREVALDSEDAVEIFILMAERQSRRGVIKRCVLFFCDLITLHKVGTQIEDIKTKLTEISNSKSSYGIPEISGGEGPSSPHRRLQDYRQNVALADDDDVVGFEGDVNALVKRLTEGHSRRCIISLVAMGGAGKTTVAKKVYNHRNVKTHFGGKYSAWVCVSQKYVVKELLQNIAKQIMKPKEDEANQLNQLSVNELQDKLSEFLKDKDKRYLIVLDDIWEIAAWDQLRAAFPDVMNGSRIMFTTRNKDVASRADPDPSNLPHELPLLSDKESMELLLKRVFPWQKGEINSCPSELEELGEQIVKKCGRLPLAIAVIGSLLSAKEQTPSSWRNVLDSLTWQLSEQETVHCSDILALSYYDLPPYLKPCFLYMGVFPEDREIRVKRLIHLWVAEGFMQPRGQQIKEEVAFDCLLELIGRSMIQVAERRFDGSIRTCRIHDLLRDLALVEARQGHFFEIDRNVSDSSSSVMTRRLIIHDETAADHNPYDHITPKLRSWLCFTKSLPKLPDRGAKLLRILELEGFCVGNAWIANVLGELIHLKYLNLKDSDVDIIPQSIGKLYNLEYLRLGGGGILSERKKIRLPKEIWELKRLRHLNVALVEDCVFEGNPRLTHLRNLQTLSLIAGSWIEEDSLGALVDLRKLKVGRASQKEGNILSRSIEKLINLESLEISAKQVTFPPLKHHLHLYKMSLAGPLGKLPDFHEFPPTLTKLALMDSRLEEDSMATLEKLPNLQFLQLASAYNGKKMITSAQGFPRLKNLELLFLRTLEEWIVEKGALPALERLRIYACRGLKMLPEGLKDVTTLRELGTIGMSGDFNDRLENSNGVDWYKVQHHIPSVRIEH